MILQNIPGKNGDSEANCTILAVHIEPHMTGLIDQTRKLISQLQEQGITPRVIVSPSGDGVPELAENQVVMEGKFRCPEVTTERCILTGQQSTNCVTAFAQLLIKQSKKTGRNLSIHIPLEACEDPKIKDIDAVQAEIHDAMQRECTKGAAQVGEQQTQTHLTIDECVHAITEEIRSVSSSH